MAMGVPIHKWMVFVNGKILFTRMMTGVSRMEITLCDVYLLGSWVSAMAESKSIPVTW